MLALALAVSVAGQDIDPVQFKRCDASQSTGLWRLDRYVSANRCSNESF